MTGPYNEQVISMGYGIVVFRNHFRDSANFIAKLESTINQLSEDNRWKKSEVSTPEGNVVSDTRTNAQFILSRNINESVSNSVSQQALWQMAEHLNFYFSECLDRYLCFVGGEVSSRLQQSYVVLKYESTEKFLSHMDDGPRTPRRVSALCYLNDKFKGGHLEFPFFGIRYAPCEGDLVFFPSGLPYHHLSSPIESGIKYSVVAWWS